MPAACWCFRRDVVEFADVKLWVQKLHVQRRQQMHQEEEEEEEGGKAYRGGWQRNVIGGSACNGCRDTQWHRARAGACCVAHLKPNHVSVVIVYFVNRRHKGKKRLLGCATAKGQGARGLEVELHCYRVTVLTHPVPFACVFEHHFGNIYILMYALGPYLPLLNLLAGTRTEKQE
jgi:hypothetical protein